MYVQYIPTSLDPLPSPEVRVGYTKYYLGTMTFNDFHYK